MSHIRLISPRVPLPNDRPVQLFYANGSTDICRAVHPEKLGAVAWCEPATADGTVSGPVHSLEPVELPEPFARVLVYLHRDRKTPLVGYRDDDSGWWLVRYSTNNIKCDATGWRPLDDEPGDAELLEAAKAVLRFFEGGDYPSVGRQRLFALSELVRKRTEGGK